MKNTINEKSARVRDTKRLIRRRLRTSFPFTYGLIKRVCVNRLDIASAETAYYLLFGSFPLLAAIVTLMAFFPIDITSLLEQIQPLVPDNVFHLIVANLDTIVARASYGVMSVSFIFALWSASRGIVSLTRALNRSFDVRESRSFVMQNAISVLFTIFFCLIIIITLLLLVFGGVIGNYFLKYSVFFAVWSSLRHIISLLMLIFFFASAYLAMPSMRMRPSDIFWGSLFATFAWLGVSIAFSSYVNTFNRYSILYGSLGGIIAFMMWLYLSVYIFLLGGEINAQLMRMKDKSTDRA